MFEGSAMVSAALPLVFAGYLAVVPEYGSHPILLFGFLLMIDAGLLAISLALRRPPLHVIGAVMTVFTWAVWLITSYRPGDWAIAVSFVSAFAALYLFAPGIAGWFKRPLTGSAARAVHAAAALLFVFPVLARIEPAAASPWPIFGVLLVLVVLCGWHAAVLDRGGVFFAASFFAVATQAVWSATHLTVDRLRPAVIVYALFGVTLTAIPVVARRMKHPLRPEGGPGLAHRKPGAVAVSHDRAHRSRGTLGHGAAARDPECRHVRRERLQPHACAIEDRQHAVLGGARILVVPDRWHGWIAAITRRRDRTDPGYAGRSRLDACRHA
jgi:hypothetical protein